MKRARSLVAFALLALPSEVLACPVCSPARDDATQQAFFSMTIFMTLLPLAMFGALIYWVIRRIRALEARERLELSAEE